MIGEVWEGALKTHGAKATWTLKLDMQTQETVFSEAFRSVPKLRSSPSSSPVDSPSDMRLTYSTSGTGGPAPRDDTHVSQFFRMTWVSDPQFSLS